MRNILLPILISFSLSSAGVTFDFSPVDTLDSSYIYNVVRTTADGYTAKIDTEKAYIKIYYSPGNPFFNSIYGSRKLSTISLRMMDPLTSFTGVRLYCNYGEGNVDLVICDYSGSPIKYQPYRSSEAITNPNAVGHRNIASPSLVGICDPLGRRLRTAEGVYISSGRIKIKPK
jgi:hypothetical protein